MNKVKILEQFQLSYRYLLQPNGHSYLNSYSEEYKIIYNCLGALLTRLDSSSSRFSK